MSAPIPPEIITAAQSSQAKWGIPASISIAQWAVESARGTRMPPGSNNPFGIKARAGEPSVGARTREVINGQTVYINDGFRKFASIAEAFDEHGKFLATRSPYANARKVLPDANAFADALTGVYATDPHYGAALKAIMRGANLYQYDVGGLVPAQPTAQRILRKGDRGDDVAALQRKLGILADGIFGAGTEAVVKVVQRVAGLAQDGIVGPRTWEALK